MRVRLGWSGEVEPNNWRKADVTLEEEDLQRMMLENGLPESSHESFGTQVCFALLEAEAEALLIGKMRSFGFPAARATTRIEELNAKKSAILGALKKKVAAGSE